RSTYHATHGRRARAAQHRRDTDVTLDLVQVAEQLPLLIRRAAQERSRMGGALGRAVQHLRAAADDPDAYEARIRQAQSSWTLALPVSERLDSAFDPP